MVIVVVIVVMIVVVVVVAVARIQDAAVESDVTIRPVDVDTRARAHPPHTNGCTAAEGGLCSCECCG